MNKLLTAITLLVLGINISAACNLYDMEMCVKNKADCSLAAVCENAAEYCSRTKECYENTAACEALKLTFPLDVGSIVREGQNLKNLTTLSIAYNVGVHTPTDFGTKCDTPKRNSVSALSSCSEIHSCVPPFSYRYTVQNACVPVQSAASVPRLTVFAGFSAITVSLLAYFYKE